MSRVKHRQEQYFSNRIEKEIRKVDKDGNEDIITIYYKIKFIRSARFSANYSLAEGIHKINCKGFDSFLEYESVKVKIEMPILKEHI